MNDQEDSDGLTLYPCAYCGETNEILIDESIGKSHEIIEDCYVCCKPNVVHIINENGRWECWSTPENE